MRCTVECCTILANKKISQLISWLFAGLCLETLICTAKQQKLMQVAEVWVLRCFFFCDVGGGTVVALIKQ